MFDRYRLEKEKDGYTLVLYLNSNSTEFSEELGHIKNEKRKDLYDSAQSFAKIKFSDYKVKEVRVVMGSLLLAIIPISVKEVATDINKSSAINNYSSYIVVPGDSLQSISNKTLASIDDIKSINNLTKNLIYPNQVLKIPLSLMRENPSH